jgi:CMP-N,N'-diacetyllegionaminic acid synthase
LNILILIPARKGSKRITDKNIKELGGKPLILWTIEFAKKIDTDYEILVTTDSTEIQNLALSKDILCPWLRPKELSTDTATSVDVALHATNWYEENVRKIDGLLLLQPTSPFRNIEEVQKGIWLFQSNKKSSIVGVSPAINHPQWTFRIKNGQLNPFLDFGGINQRSQDLEPAYSINGSFYLISPEDLRYYKSFILYNSIGLVSEKNYSRIDIDTIEDWEVAEYIIKSGKFL